MFPQNPEIEQRGIKQGFHELDTRSDVRRWVEMFGDDALGQLARRRRYQACNRYIRVEGEEIACDANEGTKMTLKEDQHGYRARGRQIYEQRMEDPR